MLSGTILAQALPILLSPVITRLYSPEEMGIYALFVSISSILAIFVTARYEAAIIIPKHIKRTLGLVSLVIWISVSMSSFILIIFVIFDTKITMFEGLSTLNGWLSLLGINIFLAALYQSCYSWANRHGHFKNMAGSRVLRASTVAFLQLVFGALKFSSWGLIVGIVCGNLIAILPIATPLPRLLSPVKRRARKYLWLLAVQFRRFPQINLWSALLEATTSHLPIFLLAVLFDPSLAGVFALAQRAIRAPVSMVAIAIGDVFRHQASVLLNETGNCQVLFLKIVRIQFSIAVAPTLILLIWGPDLFAFVFGEAWQFAGEITRILSIMFLLQFIASPIGCLFILRERQSVDLVIQTSLGLGALASLVIGKVVFDDVRVALFLFSVVYAMKYVAEIVLCYKYSKPSHLGKL